MTLSTPSPFPLESSNKNCLSYQTWRKKANGDTDDTDKADDADDTEAKKASSILGFFLYRRRLKFLLLLSGAKKSKRNGECVGVG